MSNLNNLHIMGLTEAELESVAIAGGNCSVFDIECREFAEYDKHGNPMKREAEIADGLSFTH